MNDETALLRKKHVVGEAMQQLMAERGCNLTLEESRRFVLDLLRLVELGAIVPVEPPPAGEPDDDASS